MTLLKPPRKLTIGKRYYCTLAIYYELSKNIKLDEKSDTESYLILILIENSCQETHKRRKKCSMEEKLPLVLYLVSVPALVHFITFPVKHIILESVYSFMDINTSTCLLSIYFKWMNSASF